LEKVITYLANKALTEEIAEASNIAAKLSTIVLQGHTPIIPPLSQAVIPRYK
jgi:hypothetical protein